MSKIAVTEEELEIARLAIEDELVSRRDSRIATLRNNGLCIKECNGDPSGIIRMGIVEALQLAVTAINVKRGV